MDKAPTYTQTQLELVELRKDIESLTSTVASLAMSVEKLVAHQYKYELVEQEIRNLRREVNEYIGRDSSDANRVWKKLEEHEKKIDDLTNDTSKNMWGLKLVSVIGMLVTGGLISWIVKAF